MEQFGREIWEFVVDSFGTYIGLADDEDVIDMTSLSQTRGRGSE